MSSFPLVLNSHKNNGHALEHLLESLEKCPEYAHVDITVVIGGHATYSIRHVERHKTPTIFKTITYVESPYNAIDYNGLLALIDLPELHRKAYFYLHDTTRAGPAFLKRLMKIPHNTSSASFRWPSMNIGYYSHDLVEKHKEILQSFRNRDIESEKVAQELKAKCVEHEDCIFKLNDDHIFFSLDSPLVLGEPHDYYGTSTQRILEYYASMDLYKVKANWYGKPVYELRV